MVTYLAAFHLMERKGVIFNRNTFRLKDVRYIPLTGDYNATTANDAWIKAVEMAKQMESSQDRTFHHVERIVIFQVVYHATYF